MTDSTPTFAKKPASGGSGTPRFYKLSDVAAVLAISESQVYALVRSGDLPAIKIGGRGQWRVEATARAVDRRAVREDSRVRTR